MAKGGHSHRPTMKKDHKPFKSKHSSKGEMKKLNKGKVEKSSNGNKSSGKVLSKIERKNQAKQLKDKKMLETKLIRKLFDGSSGIEKVVTIIPLTNDLSAVDIAKRLINSIDADDITDFNFPSVTNMKIQRFKSNLKIIVPDSNDLLSILDAAKVSDYLVFGISATTEIDPNYGEQIVRAIIAQGCPSVMGVLPNLVSAFPKKNLQDDIRQSLQSYFNHFFPGEEKLFALENDSECVNSIRSLCQKFPKSVSWRDSRGYMIAENLLIEEGKLVVEGTVRGTGFSCNNLVHINGQGDFQIDHIEKISNSIKMDDLDMDDVYTPDENQETLEELNPEEIEMDEELEDLEDLEEDDYEQLGVRMDGKNYFHDSTEGQPKRRYKVPKGTSEYQSKWLLNDVLEGASDVESGEEEEGETEEPEMDMEEAEEQMEEEEDMEDEEQGDSEMHVDLSPEEEERQLEEFRANVKEDMEFPDEIELHPKESAKEALKKYRGVKSLGNCVWDCDEYDEEAPEEWNRLLRISNFKNTKNKVSKDAIKNAQIGLGNRAKIYIKVDNVEALATKMDYHNKPMIVYGLLNHEHKLGVVNFSFQNWEDYEESIPGKEEIIAQYGPRRQVITPIFNQASNTSNNVHKLEQFHHPGNVSIATCIAPVLFNNAPTIFFKQNKETGDLQLIGQGTFLNCDHTRVVAERAILTGHPVKFHKRVVTVRYMFFSREDINWFKAIPLYTKLGRTGFIKESLGTHGYFKATFDGKLSAQDVVAMNLHKRAWPSSSTMFSQ